MYKYPFFMYKLNLNTRIIVCIHKYNYSYNCNYVLSSKSGLRLVVNKKSCNILSAF